MNIKGNYPFAVLHTFKTEGFKAAVAYAISVSREKIDRTEATEYVRAAIKTNGQPKLLDLFE